MKITKEKILTAIKKILSFLLNPRFILCFGIGWIITNGWCYVFLALGPILNIPWMTAIGAAYGFFLWGLPTPEKIVTVAIAIYLLKKFFPDDKKTLAVLLDIQKKIKDSIAEAKAKRNEKKRLKKEEKEKNKSKQKENA